MTFSRKLSWIDGEHPNLIYFRCNFAEDKPERMEYLCDLKKPLKNTSPLKSDNKYTIRMKNMNTVNWIFGRKNARRLWWEMLKHHGWSWNQLNWMWRMEKSRQESFWKTRENSMRPFLRVFVIVHGSRWWSNSESKRIAFCSIRKDNEALAEAYDPYEMGEYSASDKLQKFSTSYEIRVKVLYKRGEYRIFSRIVERNGTTLVCWEWTLHIKYLMKIDDACLNNLIFLWFLKNLL